MKYLFIDTSLDKLTVALTDEQKLLSEKIISASNDYSKNTLVELSKMFNDVNLKPSEIDKIFVVNGPGSFTGVRIGVTIAKTYAWSLEKSVIPISSLKSYALSFSNYDYYISVIDARRNHVYAGIYNNHYDNVIPEAYVSIDELYKIINKLDGNYIILGNIDINDKKAIAIEKLDVVSIINYYSENNNSINYHELKPNYLKKVEAEEKLKEEIK